MPLKTLIHLIPLILFCFSAKAEEASSNLWQGEWQSQAADKRQYGISIKNCDSNSKCEVDTFGIAMGMNCLRHGNSEPTSNANKLIIHITGWGKDETSCTLQLEHDQNTPSVRLSQLSAATDTCTMHACEPIKIGEQRVYSLKSKDNFVGRGWNASPCTGDLSKAARVWCTDNELQSLAESIHHIPLVPIDTDFSYANNQGKPFFWLDKTLQKCDSVRDIKDCLKKEYESKITELTTESQKTATTYGPAGDTSEAKSLIQKMEGVYKRHFENGNVGGDKYKSEDVLEFVGVSDSAAYIKMHLEFFNGHQCGIAGIVEYKKIGGFVFQDPESENSCLLTIRLKGEAIDFDDPEGNCHKFCGARGGFNGEGFKLSQKRHIRYMPVIVKSAEYQKALQEYEKRHSHQSE